MDKIILLIVTLFSLSTYANDGSKLWMGKMNLDVARKVTVKHVDGLGEGFNIEAISPERIVVQASTPQGGAYGRMAVARLTACGRIGKGMQPLSVKETPAFKYRILNHWDNLDGTIERGYAGRSIFWSSRMKGEAWKARIRAYGLANLSVGINGCVLNNVNASPKVLTQAYIDTVRMIANILRPYYIKVYLSVNFGSPLALGATKTADPLNADVIRWWRLKVKEIYKAVPDFGGFLVKANSEGQPGPFDYGRSHADGANMLADALKPYGGIVLWRSFVYGAKHKGEDRVKQAVSEFKDLDGQFHDNVILQSKNGPLDFQPREPYSPIFDNMPKTSQAVEFQIAQEYTGQAKHLVYLASMWKEFFGYVSPKTLKGVAGVSNIGDETNWTHHDFSQANWYAFGRLAWDPTLTSEQIADEWLRLTFSSDSTFVAAVEPMMLKSREDCVDYMMPLGLHHIFAFDGHYGPEPDGYRADYPIEWCPVYYHKADSLGIGFDRSSKGSGAVSQYREPYCSLYNNIKTCPEKYLLWFHHVPWNYEMRNGLTLWDNLQLHYNRGVKSVEDYARVWKDVRVIEQRDGDADGSRWQRVDSLLKVQADNARLWRDVCVGYFGSIKKEQGTGIRGSL